MVRDLRSAPLESRGMQHIRYRRTYILPTRFGFAFAFMLLALFLGAMNYNNNLAFLLVFLLTGLALFSMIRIHRNLVGLRILGIEAPPAYAGEPVHVSVRVGNPAGFTRLDLTLKTRPGSLQGAPLDLAPGEEAWCRLEVPTRVRGRIELGALKLVTRRPFGLFQAFSPLTLSIQATVYPKPADPPEPLPVHPATSGPNHASRVESEDFQGFRPYRRGDGRKRISWPAYAKGLGLIVKDFETPQGEEIPTLRWADAPGNLEERLSHLTRWALMLESRQQPFGLELPTESVPPDRGLRHLHRCLTCLALYPERDR